MVNSWTISLADISYTIPIEVNHTFTLFWRYIVSSCIRNQRAVSLTNKAWRIPSKARITWAFSCWYVCDCVINARAIYQAKLRAWIPWKSILTNTNISSSRKETNCIIDTRAQIFTWVGIISVYYHVKGGEDSGAKNSMMNDNGPSTWRG